MTEQELLDQIRAGVTQEMESALTADINPVLMHAVTQSYLLLKILDKMEQMSPKRVDEGMKESSDLESFTKQMKAVVLARYGVTLTDEACKLEYEEINKALKGRKNEQEPLSL